MILVYLSNSNEWPRQNFSLQYKYNIKQTSDENKEKYQLGDISWFNTKLSKLTSQELYGRIIYDILGVKG